ncbi:hypothetical protein B7494_g7937 [Chlorociboria aeruginascens]|nr:hypothetical protein B7494_g7937 [Chlorociboria aeruginascens]
MPSVPNGHAPNLSVYLKSLKTQDLEPSIENLISLLKRRQIKNSRPCAIATVHLLLRVVAKFRWTDIAKLLERVQQVGQRLIEAQPREMVVGNIIRRVLGMIRDEAKEDRSEDVSDSASNSQMGSPRRVPSDLGASRDVGPGLAHFSPLRFGSDASELPESNGDDVFGARTQNPRPPLLTSHTSYAVMNGIPVQQSMFNLLSAGPSPASTPPNASSPHGKSVINAVSLTQRITSTSNDLKAEIISGIEEIIDELDQVDDQIAGYAQEHIHSNEVILTHTSSLSVQKFLLKAAEKRKFTVIVAETYPNDHEATHISVTGRVGQALDGTDEMSTETFFKPLTAAGITVILLTDATIFAIMSRVNKVILATHAVIANGGLIAAAGARIIATAAKVHRTPVIVVSGIYKLSPEYPFEFKSLIEYGDPGSIVGYDDGALVDSLEVDNPLFDYVPPDLVDLYITNLVTAWSAMMDQLPPPPYSETDIYSNPGLSTPSASHTDATSSVEETIIYTPTESLNLDLGDEVHSPSSAASYFQSRQVQLQQSARPARVHSITVTLETVANDLQYPEPAQEWLARDVTQQDWDTFVNHLLPDHAKDLNNKVADRKLNDELIGDQMHKLTLGQQDPSRIDLRQVNAQLETLRQPLSSGKVDCLRTLDTTIAEWNEGFFRPRGIIIRLIDSELVTSKESTTIPSSPKPYDHERIPSSSDNRTGRRTILRFNPFSSMDASSSGFRMGPIVANSEGFRIGKNGLVADANGFRIGNALVADSNGFRLGRGFIADGQGDRHMSHQHRGRRQDRQHRERRCRSSFSSSSSSSSSSNSTSSNASVGSLPDYDSLEGPQLSAAKQTLIEWLSHSEQTITKETVRNIRMRINTTNKQMIGNYNQNSTTLRKEVKDLLKQFKHSKRTQKIRRKALKRERRAFKKAEKKVRRGLKRAERKSRRQEQRGKNMEGSQTANNAFPAVSFLPMTQRHSLIDKPSSRLSRGPMDLSSMIGPWPYNQDVPFAPGTSGITQGPPNSICSSSADIHAQALIIEAEADGKEAESMKMNMMVTKPEAKEGMKVVNTSKATALKEEAESLRREARRLRAEASHLDQELARELDEEQNYRQAGGYY